MRSEKMSLTGRQCEGLGVALNEAELLGFEVDPERRVASATLSVVSLPETSAPNKDGLVQLVFQPVGRVVASLRAGDWNDPTAAVVPFELEELLALVQSFEGLPTRLYGWEFFDVHEAQLERWGDRLSLDWSSGDDGRSHSICVFQEDFGERHLDLCVFFDELMVRDPDGAAVDLDDFISGGERWWSARSAGDPRTAGEGIVLLDEARPRWRRFIDRLRGTP